MNNLEYLRQISSRTQSAANASTGFFDKKTKLILVIAAGFLLLAIILFSSTSGKSSSTVDGELSRLYLRTQFLISTIDTYTPEVKSRSLRTTASTLRNSLLDINSKSEATLKNTYNVKISDLAFDDTDSESTSNTTTTLWQASITGQLDHFYASQLYYQVSHILIIEETILSKEPDANIASYINSSHTDLTKIQSDLSSFSESN